MAEQSRHRPRQSDLARLAGVSQTTISMVLSGRESSTVRIPEETRQRVLEIARMVGYVADPVARSLVGGENRLIGVYTFESVFPLGHHDFYHPFLTGIEAEAERQGYDLLLFTSATGADGVRSVFRDQVSRLRLADGCVLLGKEMLVDDIARLRDQGFPFTLIGRRDVPGGGVDYVTANYAEATTAVVERLVELGHRRIAYLCADTDSKPSADRDEGFRAGSDAHRLDGADLVVATNIGGPPPGVVPELVDAGATAFVVHESVVALRVIAELNDLGLRVPADVSVAALTDPPEPEQQSELTGFRIPRQEMGERAVHLLIGRLAGTLTGGPRAETLTCRVIAGLTSGPVRSQR